MERYYAFGSIPSQLTLETASSSSCTNPRPTTPMASPSNVSQRTGTLQRRSSVASVFRHGDPVHRSTCASRSLAPSRPEIISGGRPRRCIKCRRLLGFDEADAVARWYRETPRPNRPELVVAPSRRQVVANCRGKRSGPDLKKSMIGATSDNGPSFQLWKPDASSLYRSPIICALGFLSR